MNTPPSNDNSALLMKRFAKARWTHSTTLINSKGTLDFTRLGYERMSSLAAAFEEIGYLPPEQFSVLVGLLVDFRKAR